MFRDNLVETHGKKNSSTPPVFKYKDEAADGSLITKTPPLSITHPSPSENNPEAEKSEEEIRYVWTKDPSLLLQYFKVREQAYKEYLHLDGFSGDLDGTDTNSHILLVMDGYRCVGGARLTVKDPLVESNLPMEEDGFRLTDLFPELDLKNNKYCEYSRVCFLEGYRTGAYVDGVYRRFFEKCIEKKIKYNFAIAPLLQAKRSRRGAEKLGVKASIRYDIKVPHKPIHGSIKQMYITVIDIPDHLLEIKNEKK